MALSTIKQMTKGYRFAVCIGKSNGWCRNHAPGVPVAVCHRGEASSIPTGWRNRRFRVTLRSRKRPARWYVVFADDFC